jgi:hypothetical protein
MMNSRERQIDPHCFMIEIERRHQLLGIVVEFIVGVAEREREMRLNKIVRMA